MWPFGDFEQRYLPPPPDPYIEPGLFTAGDTLIIKKNLPLYPASQGWRVAYYLQMTGATQTFNSVAQGDEHWITVAAATTKNWAAGSYVIQGYAIKDATGERYCFFNGFIKIQVNLQTAGPDLDTRSHAKRVLDAIELTLEGRATDDILDSNIEGTQFRRLTPDQLLLLRDRYKAEYEFELKQARARKGLATGRNILVRFTRPGVG